MQDNVPNYNPHHVVRLFNNLNSSFRKPGYEGRNIEVTDLIDDQSVINSTIHQVLQSMKVRERRAIELLYGLPDSEPISAKDAAQIFYKGSVLSTDLPPKTTTIMTSHRRIKTVPLTPSDDYIQRIINTQGINPEQVTDVEVRIGYNQVGYKDAYTFGDDRREYPKKENITTGRVYDIRKNGFRKLIHPSRRRTLESLIKSPKE